ncbi:hypothetical protein [Caballeronia ptereochthonis]|uniref:Uncharacterized protein n=1 Tax=Caballeronia ptereochthonis TaxID=1777144 RepID=A0A158B6M1_9BURK|nr:hypothetical protein [Caballeronia ptereochthonis]SAK65703.1 hypothetical protein AWB83_02862 [Caballeronia ptereochthonis]
MSTGHDDLDAWKRQRTVELAFELADSGRYENFTDIAYALQFERGMATAQALIDDPDMRRLLNERCGDAREKLAPPPEPSIVEAEPSPVVEAVVESSNDHAELPQPAHFERAPSFLRRALSVVWRSGVKPVSAGDLNSAAS